MAKHLLVLLYSAVVISLTSEVLSSKWKRHKEECKMKDTEVIEQQEIKRLKECLMICEIMQNCKTVSRSSEGNTCLFSHRNVVDDKHLDYVKWELAPGWETFSKAEFPVVRVMNPDPDTNLMIFAGASQVCADHGTELATEDQLLKAAELGFDQCWCAWLSNGRVAAVIPIFVSCEDFPDADGPAVMYCDETWAPAWCKLK